MEALLALPWPWMGVEVEAMTKWFLMLRGYDGIPIPRLEPGGDAVDSGGQVALFNSREQAEAAGQSSPLGETRGYEVYEWEETP